MRQVVVAIAIVLGGCVPAGSTGSGGAPSPLVAPSTLTPDPIHFDEGRRHAEICSEKRPLDFLDNREYCLAPVED
jgi:hypothetical protein